MDISAWIDRHAGFAPEKAAIRFGGSDLSYADLAARISAAAGFLQQDLGIRHGDRVAWLGQNHPEMITLLFACARIGAILVPLNWRLEEHECYALLEDCTPKALFVVSLHTELGTRLGAQLNMPVIAADTADFIAQLGKAEAVSEPDGVGCLKDPVLISYTSGTTGQPKGVVLDQQALFTNAINSVHMHAMTHADLVLNTLPFFHVGGLNILSLPTLYSGGLLVLHPAFDVTATLDAIEKDRATLTILVPTQIVALMRDPRWNDADLSSLRVMSTGSSMVPISLIKKVHARGIPLIQVYGSTETAPIAAYLTADLAMDNEGSAGKTALHCEMRIISKTGEDIKPGETGEILIRGANITREYWKNPEATAQAIVDGWFYTGDLGHVDENGFLYVDDRKKDMVISGGENIYPAELENILIELDGIVECAVIGQSDDVWGEMVVAVLVTRDDANMTAKDISNYLKGKIARYKHPRRVIFITALPRNAMGKVVKDDLRKMAIRTLENNDGNLAEQSA